MISYSFSIPDGKGSKVCTGYIKNPIKMVAESLENFKMRFESVKGVKKTIEYREKNTSFSIVYNK